MNAPRGSVERRFRGPLRGPVADCGGASRRLLLPVTVLHTKCQWCSRTLFQHAPSAQEDSAAQVAAS